MEGRTGVAVVFLGIRTASPKRLPRGNRLGIHRSVDRGPKVFGQSCDWGSWGVAAVSRGSHYRFHVAYADSPDTFFGSIIA